MHTHRHRTRPTHRLVAGAAVAAIGLGTVWVAAPAQAAEQTVEGASFVWGLNGYAQKGIFGPWSYKNLTGDAAQLVGSVSGGTQSEYVVDPVPATSFPAEHAGKTPNAVKFTEGSGTYDADTHELALAWSGSYTVNAYPAQFGAPDEIYANPQLVVEADGSGSFSAEFTLGAGIDMSGNPVDEQSYGRLDLVTFSPGSVDVVDADTVRITPDFQGIEVDPADSSPQTRNCVASGTATGWWGSWAPEFVNTLPGSVRPHFYSTGCGGMQDLKPALPIDVTYAVDAGPVDPGGPGEPEEPGEGDVPIDVTVPEVEEPEEPGEFVWTIEGGTPAVSLGTATVRDGSFVASGVLPKVTITDTRAGQPAWAINGSVSDFASGSKTFSGKYLGWGPALAGDNTVGAGNGRVVVAGEGEGLKASSTLASAPAGHPKGSVQAEAAIDLRLPLDTGAGDYTGILTLTAVG
ncbi:MULTISPECIES: HtaA domain-containing protein [Cellulosimicrobium]|jgi:hypothetical protein|uniref:HtaA domain-containing protein n=1 Tax=Cellulosimicrobium sp. ES-005 TaxID=3163031 RepID=A0AAU8G5T4_9MICO|nr:HtaA domain-containing protein [Cellulosimicrobium cellulans]MCO7274379.1 HtaA domain-containing protein [Cellulosimicrobium cellulans]